MASRIFARHGDDDMAMMDMDDMDSGTISVYIAPNVYLAAFAIVVAFFTFINFLSIALCWQRTQSARANQKTPAKPKNILTRSYATLTAVSRELSNASLPSLARFHPYLPSPSLGAVSLLAANFTLLMVLCFYDLATTDWWEFQNIAYRCGFVSLGQLPVIFILAGKNNIVGCLTGYSHEKLNWIHRWCSRCLLLTVTLHMAYWFADWAPFDFTSYQLRNDYYTKTGFAAWFLLLWIVFSSFAPIRGWRYEFFVLQHLISMLAFTIVVFQHVPSSDYAYLWPAIAFLIFDRTVRFANVLYRNFNPLRRKATNGSVRVGAEMTPLANGYTKVTIQDPPFSWAAGQHTFASFNSIAALQNHPFTIASLPEDGKVEFIIKARNGATRKLFNHAESSFGLPVVEGSRGVKPVGVIFDGPYGKLRPLKQFDTVILVAGGIGATFTVPLMRDLVRDWKRGPETGVVTRRIRFVWAVKSRDDLHWFLAHLESVQRDVASMRASGRDVQVSISLYVTCDDVVTQTFNDAQTPPSEQLKATATLFSSAETIALADASEKTLSKEASPETVVVQEVDPRSTTPANAAKTCGGVDGTCCCQTTVEDEDADAIAEAAVCTCNCGAPPDSETDTESFDEEEKSGVQTSQREVSDEARGLSRLLSGRPHPETIIRLSLEQALGESAVVTCGPRGLNEEVRRSVVSLSDERAVHKGTGAQGIWLHMEGFGW